MLDVMKRDVDATGAAFPKKTRERLDAARRVHLQLREIRIEDAQLPARESEKPVEAFQIVAPRLEQDPLGNRLGRGLTHGALRCGASRRGTNRAAAEGAAAGGALPAAGRARRRDARGISANVRAARPALHLRRTPAPGTASWCAGPGAGPGRGTARRTSRASVDCAAAKTRFAAWVPTGTRPENAPRPARASEFSGLGRRPVAPSFSAPPPGGAGASLPDPRRYRRTRRGPGGKREIPGPLPDLTAPESRSNK